MRGCLSVLLIAVVFLAAAAWFAGPPVASALVGTGLAAAGLNAGRMDVTVEADPPILVAIGRADQVDIEADNVEWNGLEARALDLTLTDVSLIDRRAATAEGRLTGAELPNVEPPGSLATIEIEGPADDATATITIDDATVEAMAISAFEDRLGIRPERASLEEPNVIRITAGPAEVAGAMEIGPDGSIDIATPLGTVTVVEPGPSLPITFTNIAVEDDSLVLTGTLDLNDLLG